MVCPVLSVPLCAPAWYDFLTLAVRKCNQQNKWFSPNPFTLKAINCYGESDNNLPTCKALWQAGDDAPCETMKNRAVAEATRWPTWQLTFQRKSLFRSAVLNIEVLCGFQNQKQLFSAHLPSTGRRGTIVALAKQAFNDFQYKRGQNLLFSSAFQFLSISFAVVLSHFKSFRTFIRRLDSSHRSAHWLSWC